MLPAGQYIGLFWGFNPSHPPATADSLQARLAEAHAAGLAIDRLQIDWPELEPAEGVYDTTALLEPLLALQAQGLRPMLTISAYDSDGPVLPAYLEGRDFDEARLLDAFARLMDWVVPLLVAHDGWAIAIANEPETGFEDSRRLPRQMETFLRQTRQHIHAREPRLAVTITFNADSRHTHRREMTRILAQADVASFNLYGSGLFPMDAPYSAAENEAALDDLLALAGDRQMVFQELGMHSDSSLLNSSEAIQAAFFETVFARMAQEPRLRAAYVFQLVDWSPETLAFFNSVYEPDTPGWFIEQYSTVLASIGLVDYHSGRRKAAWATVRHWLERF